MAEALHPRSFSLSPAVSPTGIPADAGLPLTVFWPKTEPSHCHSQDQPSIFEFAWFCHVLSCFVHVQNPGLLTKVKNTFIDVADEESPDSMTSFHDGAKTCTARMSDTASPARFFVSHDARALMT